MEFSHSTWLQILISSGSGFPSKCHYRLSVPPGGRDGRYMKPYKDSEYWFKSLARISTVCSRMLSEGSYMPIGAARGWISLYLDWLY